MTNFNLKNDRTYWVLLASLLLFNLGLKLIRLEVPKQFVFDEYHHVFTAIRYTLNDPAAYLKHIRPPPGAGYKWSNPRKRKQVRYINVQPPLHRLLMAGSILIFGENSFAWRLSGVLLGTGALFLFALLARLLFSSNSLSLLTTFFLCFEGLVFTMSRVGMPDIPVTFFILLTLWFYVKWKKTPDKVVFLVLTGVSLGLAAGTKWTAAFVWLIIPIDLFVSHRKGVRLPSRNWILWFGTCFFLIPLFFYLLSYAHMFALGLRIHDFHEMQWNMLRIQLNSKMVHPNASNPLYWILDLNPVWMYARRIAVNRVVHIYNLGNPIIFWAGLWAVGICLWQLWKKWNWELWFVLLCYFLLWVPWCFSPRGQFIHRYLPAVPFLCLLLAHAFVQFKEKLTQPRKYFRNTVLVLSVLWFVVFYPHLTAYPMPEKFVNKFYRAFPTWK